MVRGAKFWWAYEKQRSEVAAMDKWWYANWVGLIKDLIHFKLHVTALRWADMLLH